MEGQEKSKKVAKEKRSVKRTKTVALPAKEIRVVQIAPEAAKPSVRKSAGTATVAPPVRSSKAKEPGYEQVQLRAYFIGERRKSLGIPGSETSDWVQAELELKGELEAE
jgi:hypothetical protein